MSTDRPNCRPIAFRLIMVTACMASTGGQKWHVPPINGGQTGIVGAAANYFALPVFIAYSTPGEWNREMHGDPEIRSRLQPFPQSSLFFSKLPIKMSVHISWTCICCYFLNVEADVFEKLYFAVKKVAHIKQNLTNHKRKKVDASLYAREIS